ncbi:MULTISPECIES: glycogen debranching N-terminal domain-containing protein [unclassified Streptomyces]|uniref:glycogen debranching N-terminal domain-containing protein n=1 Tax=unclassified Streptomyces TaxID=2593676 RepID=UPI001F04E08E|nr:MULTISPECIES: glycogen debranching N-terminal domain-containing protein [unclassified Streptomyces]MCH0561879.1 glycogen debranching protein [Streptomyces sp. MUM 2J]MCH0568808.1 glycogen debranching protein [Streptomyces sp. MUM 136J]
MQQPEPPFRDRHDRLDIDRPVPPPGTASDPPPRAAGAAHHGPPAPDRQRGTAGPPDGSSSPTVGRAGRTPPAPSGTAAPPSGHTVSSRTGELPSVHTALICLSLPGLAVSADHGQLNGRGLEGFYRSGRRVLSRCQVRVAGREPLPVQARTDGADRARFVATVRASPDAGPDPDLVVERLRCADGTERITLRSTARRPLRLPVEIALGTDLADLAAIAAGRAGRELPATVQDAGLRWSCATGTSSVTADPPPADALASAGLLRWEVDLPPGAAASIRLRVRPDGAGPLRSAACTTTSPLAAARATGDDPGVPALLETGIADLRALLLRDPAHPSDIHLAAGAPWRCGLAPAEALAAARMALPLGTRLAAGTLRALARTQLTEVGPWSGTIPGPRRDAGPHLPPGCTGTEATLLFPVLLAEARRWGLPERDLDELLPTAERCLTWLRSAVDEAGYLHDPQPDGPARCETQAHAHRAALLGADLLDACGRPGGDGLRQWAARMRRSFRQDFWTDGPGGGRPVAARTPDGRSLPHLGAAAVHLLDTGLLGAGEQAPGLLDEVRTERLARLLGGPALDSGWGLRGLGAKEPGHNPFGHRSGAVRVHETAVAVAGLAAAGHEREAGPLLRGVLAAAGHFGHRLPEMYAGEQRTEGSLPLPHPAACRPAATAAAAGVLMLTAAAGIRPDVPGGTVTLRPLRGAPLGELGLTGLSVACAPFSVRVSRLGLAMVEEVAQGLQLRA